MADEDGGLFASLEGRFEAFLSWSEEKGLPFKSWADALEENGIPPLPLFILVVLILLGVVAVFLFPVISPPTSDLIVSVTSIGGTPLPGVPVSVSPVEFGKFGARVNNTDATGQIVFKGLPRVDVDVSTSVPGGAFADQSRKVSLDQATKTLDLSLVSLSNNKVSLSVSVHGPTSATVLLFDDAGVKLDEATGLSPSFNVAQNASYEVRVVADGYAQESKVVQVGSTDTLPVVIRLTQNGKAKTGSLYVGVFESASPTAKGIANATVTVLDNATGKTLATLLTGSGGTVRSDGLPLSASVIVSAAADGFLASSTNATIIDDTNVRVNLAPLSADAALAIKVQVVNENGTAVSAPTIRLYANGVRQAEKIPVDGLTSFDQPAGSSLLLTAYKEGYLPAKMRLPANEAKGFHTLILKTNDGTNAGTVNVLVKDSKGAGVSGASVSLSDDTGDPYGFGEKTTGADGAALFLDVPLKTVKATASLGARTQTGSTSVTLAGTPDKNGSTLLTLTFPAAKGKVSFSVRDAYSNTTLPGVKVNASTDAGSASCTTNRKGACSIQVEEGAGTAEFTLTNYDTAQASFTSDANAPDIVNATLTPSGVEANAKLQFIGIYDDQGRRVSTLAPVTRYTARYVIRNPGVDFTQAHAHIRIGELAASGDEAAEIVDFEAPGAVITSGTDYGAAQNNPPQPALSPTKQPTRISTPLPTLTPSPSQSLASRQLSFATQTPTPVPTRIPTLAPTPTPTLAPKASATPTGYKWVDFAFNNFKGSRELSVSFKTKAVSTGTVTLYHRSSFNTTLGVLRDPADANAGISYNELLAAVTRTTQRDISFQGECVDNVCVTYWLEDASGTRSQTDFETALGSTFQLKFNALLQGNAKASVTTSDPALELQGASVSGEEQKASQDLHADANGRATGAFTFSALGLTKAAPIDVQFTGNQGETVEKTLYVRVTGNPTLRVDVQPTSIPALKDSTVRFDVTDSITGRPVDNARILIGSDTDAANGKTQQIVNVDAQGAAGNPRSIDAGVYKAALSPERAGTLTWSVEAGGYPRKSGTLDVTADELVSVEPNALTLSTEDKNAGSATFTVTNLLQNDVQVSANAIADQNPQYSTLLLNPTSARLHGGGSATFTLNLKLRDDLLAFAQRGGALNEQLTGRVHVTARLATVTDERGIPFQAKARFAQQSLTDLWGVSTDSLSFELNPPTKQRLSQKVTVTNKASVPLLINQQASPASVRVTPLSAVIDPGESADFTVTASVAGAFNSDGCYFEGSKDQGNVDFFASFDTIRSGKSIKLDVSSTPGGNCAPTDGLRIVFPTDLVLSLPDGFRSKTNDDGSLAVELPTAPGATGGGLRMLFEFSKLYGNELSVPTGATLTLPRQLVVFKDLQGYQAQVSFPVAVRAALPVNLKTASGANTQTDFPPYAAQPVPVKYETYKLIFPVGSRLVSAPTPGQYLFQGLSPAQTQQAYFNNGVMRLRQPQNYVQVYPYSPIEIQPLSQDELQNIDDKVLLRQFPGFGVDAVFEIPNPHLYGADNSVYLEKCAQIKVTDSRGRPLAVLPGALRIHFNGAVQLPTQAPGQAKPPNPLRVLVPAGTPYDLALCRDAGGKLSNFQACFSQPAEFFFDTTADVSESSGVAEFPECTQLQIKVGQSARGLAGTSSLVSQLSDFPLGVQSIQFPRAVTQFLKETDSRTGNEFTAVASVAGTNAKPACVEFTPCADFADGALGSGGPVITGINYFKLTTASGDPLQTTTLTTASAAPAAPAPAISFDAASAPTLVSSELNFADSTATLAATTPSGVTLFPLDDSHLVQAGKDITRDAYASNKGFVVELRGDKTQANLVLYFHNDAPYKLDNAGLATTDATLRDTQGGGQARAADLFSASPSVTRWAQTEKEIQRQPLDEFVKSKKPIPYNVRLLAPAVDVGADGCIKHDTTYKLELVFTASASSGTPVAPVKVPVTIHVLPGEHSECRVADALKKYPPLVGAQGATAPTKTLVFKEIGHTLPVWLAANSLEDWTVTTTGLEGKMTCTATVYNPDGSALSTGTLGTTPLIIPAGHAALAQCTSTAYTSTVETWTVHWLGSKGTQLPQSWSVRVYSAPDSMKVFYQKAGSPWGTVAKAGSVTAETCNSQFQFCSYDQLTQALQANEQALYAQFIDPLDKADDKTWAQTQTAFCNDYKTTGQQYDARAVYVFQKTASFSNQAADPSTYYFLDLQNRLFPEFDAQLFSDKTKWTKGSPYVVLKESSVDASTCGIYQLTTRVASLCNPATTKQLWRENVAFEHTLTKLAGCAPTLANAPLYLERYDGTTSDTQTKLTAPEYAVGAQPAGFVDFFKHPRQSVVDAFNLNFEKSVIPLGAYANNLDPHDQQTAQALYASLYGVPLANAPPVSHTVARYYDAAFCTSEGLKNIGTVSGVLLGGTLVSLLLALPSGGTSLTIGGYFAAVGTNLGTAGLFCGAQATGTAVGSQNADRAVCLTTNNCLQTIVETAAIPGAGPLKALLKGSTLLFTGGLLLASGIGSAYTSTNDAPHPSSPWRDMQFKRSQLAQSSQALIAGAPALGYTGGAAYSSLRTRTELASFKQAARDLSFFDGYSDAQLSAFAGKVENVLADNPSIPLTDAIQTASLTEGGGGIALTSADAELIANQIKDVIQPRSVGVSTIRATASSLGRTLGLAALYAKLFHVDVTPVELFFDTYSPSYVAAFHGEGSDLTATRICEFGDKDCTRVEPLAGKCASTSGVCLGVYSKTTLLKQSNNAVTTHTLVASTAERVSQAESKKFFDSLFSPASAPMMLSGNAPASVMTFNAPSGST